MKCIRLRQSGMHSAKTLIINKGQKLTDEQLQEVIEAKRNPIVFDELSLHYFQINADLWLIAEFEDNQLKQILKAGNN